MDIRRDAAIEICAHAHTKQGITREFQLPQRRNSRLNCPQQRTSLWGKSMWSQIYNPLGSELLSTLVAAIPVVVLLVLIATGKVGAHVAAIIALVAAIAVAIVAFTMPAGLAIRASVLGLVTGFFPIGW